MDIFVGEDLNDDLKEEINFGVRYAMVNSVNDELIELTQENQESERVKYATINLTFIDFPGKQQRISLTGFERTSGDLKIPEKGSICLCVFLPSRRALVLTLVSGWEIEDGKATTKRIETIRDLVKNGTLLPLKQGEHVKWTDNKVYSYIRKCTKMVTQTLGKLLDSTLTAVKVDGKDIHYQLEHESGAKFRFDEDGNVYVTLVTGQKLFLNNIGSVATDDDALLTRKFLTEVAPWAHPMHLHSTTTPGSPTGPVLAPVPPMPDGVSTPQVRGKRS